MKSQVSTEKNHKNTCLTVIAAARDINYWTKWAVLWSNCCWEL